jgi:carbon starvation protein CstA
MRIGRLRDGEWIAGVGGLALLASLFLGWYSGASAWQAFSVLDVVLALLALVPLALVVLQATRESPSLPVAFSVLTTLAGALATLLILYRILNQPGPNDRVAVELGAWIGLAAAAIAAVGGWRSLREEEIPGLPLPPVEELPVPAP